MITDATCSSKIPGWLADQLDEATVALSRFKEQLDKLGNAERDAIFALADPGHPCLEKLIVLLGEWADRLRESPKEGGQIPPLLFADGRHGGGDAAGIPQALLDDAVTTPLPRAKAASAAVEL